VGLIWQPVEPTVFKLLYGQAFRAPNAYESYYSGTGSEPNLNLRPEKISTYELDYEQKLPYRVNFSASTYYYHIHDLIDQQLDPANGLIIYQNVRDVDAVGAEFELERRMENGFEVRLSYTLQRSEDAATHQELTSSPRHLLKGNLAIPLYLDKVLLGLEAQYNTSVWTLQGNQIGGPLLVNATLFSQKLIKGWEMSASLYNLLGYRYSYPGGAEHTQDAIPQDGRSFRVKLTYRF
jgi:iron complex outermembrane receptor protein